MTREYLMIYRDQAFLRSYDLAPPSPVSNLSLFLSLPVSPVVFNDRRGVGKEPNHNRKKARPSINNTILSGNDIAT